MRITYILRPLIILVGSHLDQRLKLLERIKLRLSGNIYLYNVTKEGWTDSLPLYLFECPIHGLVKAYPKGYSNRLECPLCLKDQTYDAHDENQEEIHYEQIGTTEKERKL
jgi:hypothetical protein